MTKLYEAMRATQLKTGSPFQDNAAPLTPIGGAAPAPLPVSSPVSLTTPIPNPGTMPAISKRASAPALFRGELATGQVDRASLMGLYQTLQMDLSHCPQKILGFTSARSGEGTTTIVRETASTLVHRIGRSVLVVDTDPRMPLVRHFQGSGRCGLDEIADRPDALDIEMQHASVADLCVIPLTRSGPLTARAYEQLMTDRLIDQLRGRFEYVLFDLPAVGAACHDIALLRHFDGVVMVVEAETTRMPVFLNAKRMIEGFGGNLLGVIMNKRKYYIPEKIYRLL